MSTPKLPNVNINNKSPVPKLSATQSPRVKKKPVKVIILAGGPSKGTRFRPLSFETPKPFFPIGGKEMIAHHIEAAFKINSESDEFYLSDIFITGFFKKEVFKPFCDNYFKQYDFEIKYLEEKEQSGTAGGIASFEQVILADQSTQDADILIMNADLCSSFPLISLLKSHELNKRKGALCTLLSTNVSNEESIQYGNLVLKDTKVVHYVEKPTTFVNNAINCGIYVFDHSILKQLSAYSSKKQDSHLSIEHDIFIPLVEKKALYSFQLNEKDFWFPIKTASDALLASHLYLTHKNTKIPKQSFKFTVTGENSISSTAKIDHSAKIGPNVVIGKNVIIGKGVRISNSIILDNAIIRDFTFVTRSIIGWRSEIGKWTRVEGSPVSSTVTHSVPTENEPKITIVGHDVTIGNEVVIRDSIVLPNKQLSQDFSNRIIL